MNKVFLTLALLLVCISMINAQTLLGTIQNNTNLSFLYGNLTNNGPLFTLLSGSNVTYIAPTNTALNNLPTLNLTGIYPNLNETLYYHGGNNQGQISQQAVEGTYQTFVAGKFVKVSNYTSVATSGLLPVLLVNGVQATGFLNATNGNGATVGQVLYPPIGDTVLTLSRCVNFTEAINFVNRASPAVRTAISTSPGTFFVPSNAAFVAFNQTLLTYGTNLSALNQTTVDAFVLNHLVNRTYTLFPGGLNANSVTLANVPSNYQSNALNLTKNGNTVRVTSLGNLNPGSVINEVLTTNAVLLTVSTFLQPSGFFPVPTPSPAPTTTATPTRTPSPTPRPSSATALNISILILALISLLFNF